MWVPPNQSSSHPFLDNHPLYFCTSMAMETPIMMKPQASPAALEPQSLTIFTVSGMRSISLQLQTPYLELLFGVC